MRAPSIARLVTLLGLVMSPSVGRARAAHRVSIDIRGPLALVEVERPLVFGAEYGRAASDEVVVDLDLPEGAALAGAELRAGPRSLRLGSGPAPDAGRRYAEAVRAAGWRAAAVSLDEGVDLRLKVAGPGLGEPAGATPWSLRYRFVAPLSCRDGRLLLSIPGSLDPAPTDAEVSIRLQLGGLSFAGASPATLEVDGQALRPTGGTVARARTSLSVRRAWQLAIGRPPAGPRAGLGTAFAAGASIRGRGCSQWHSAGPGRRALRRRPPGCSC